MLLDFSDRVGTGISNIARPLYLFYFTLLLPYRSFLVPYIQTCIHKKYANYAWGFILIILFGVLDRNELNLTLSSFSISVCYFFISQNRKKSAWCLIKTYNSFDLESCILDNTKTRIVLLFANISFKVIHWNLDFSISLINCKIIIKSRYNVNLRIWSSDFST